MRRPSALDAMVRNFQHNWETNPQFRALWSGGLGLAIVVMLCACLGFAFTFAGAAASAFTPGSSSASIISGNGGTPRPGSIDSNVAFPTQTIPAWAQPYIPAGAPIPPSTTPMPSPTALPTATPVPTTTGGPGGGGGGGGGYSNTVTFVSATLKPGTTGTVIVHTTTPNTLINVFVKSPWTSPQNTGQTDGSGNGTIPIANVPQSCNGPVTLWISAQGAAQITATAACG